MTPETPGGEDHRIELKRRLKTLGWSQRQLCEFLTAAGEPVTPKRIEGWMASPGASGKRNCPKWPCLILDLLQTRKSTAFADFEVEILKTLYPEHGAAHCAEVLARSSAEVREKCRELGIVSNVAYNKKWKPGFDATLKKGVSEGLTAAQVAKQLRVTEPTVRAHAQKLGLDIKVRKRRRSPAASRD